MSLMVHFMHPTKHWLLGRVHAVHHEIEIPSIDNCVGPVSPVKEYLIPFCLVACLRNHARNRKITPKRTNATNSMLAPTCSRVWKSIVKSMCLSHTLEPLKRRRVFGNERLSRSVTFNVLGDRHTDHVGL